MSQTALAVGAGVVLAAVLVVVVLLSTLGADDGQGAPPTTKPVPTEENPSLLTDMSESPLARSFSLPTEVPPGDYTRLCAEIERQTKRLGSQADFNGVVAWYQALDFERLKAIAPEGFVPTLQDLEDARPEVIETFKQVDSARDLSVGDVPHAFLSGLESLVKVGISECKLLEGGTGGKS